jgi:hypothetical protein
VEDEGILPELRGKRPWTSMCVAIHGFPSPSRDVEKDPQPQRLCLTRAVNSCTRLYTVRSSRIRRVIFCVACITVV